MTCLRDPQGVSGLLGSPPRPAADSICRKTVGLYFFNTVTAEFSCWLSHCWAGVCSAVSRRLGQPRHPPYSLRPYMTGASHLPAGKAQVWKDENISSPSELCPLRRTYTPPAAYLLQPGQRERERVGCKRAIRSLTPVRHPSPARQYWAARTKTTWSPVPNQPWKSAAESVTVRRADIRS